MKAALLYANTNLVWTGSKAQKLICNVVRLGSLGPVFPHATTQPAVWLIQWPSALGVADPACVIRLARPRPCRGASRSPLNNIETYLGRIATNKQTIGYEKIWKKKNFKIFVSFLIGFFFEKKTFETFHMQPSGVFSTGSMKPTNFEKRVLEPQNFFRKSQQKFNILRSLSK